MLGPEENARLFGSQSIMQPSRGSAGLYLHQVPSGVNLKRLQFKSVLVEPFAELTVSNSISTGPTQAKMTSDTHDIVPGTVHLVDLVGHQSKYQHASGRQDIVLVPQPSDDPEDPLRWSSKRKFWALTMVMVYTLGTGIPTTLHYSVLADITRDTGISTAELVQGNGVMFLFLGCEWPCPFGD